MLDLLPLLCGECGCPYNDLAICKNSSDCLGQSKIFATTVEVNHFFNEIILIGTVE